MDIIILVFSLVLLLKEKFAWVLFVIIFLTTAYLGAGTNLSDALFPHNVSDSGLVLYLVLSFYILSKHKFKLPKTDLTRYILIFFLFLIFSFIVDLLFNGIDLISILKTSRHWIFLTCIWTFYYIPEKETEKLIKYLLYALLFISVIMLIEFFYDVHILAEETKTEYTPAGYLIRRGAIPSILVIFFIILLFSKYFKTKIHLKYLYAGIFLAVIVTSMIRSWIAATIFGIILVFNLNKKIILKNFFAGIIITLGLILIIISNPIINERFNYGIEEIQSFSPGGIIQGNFSFRMLQAAERINYVFQNPQYFIFGIGNVIEQNFPYIFKIGLKNESGIVTQLDTGDIAWSLLVLRLGFVGTFLILIFYFRLMKTFYQRRFNNPLALATLVFLFVNLIMVSFASSLLATGQFFLLPILFYYYEEKLINE